MLIEDLYGESVAEVEQTIQSSHAPEYPVDRFQLSMTLRRSKG